ncbi:MAG TPA: amino acid permease [Gemmatimonadales bacterium]|nr:amino acid permease [Gemmatimonadales bacterium]
MSGPRQLARVLTLPDLVLIVVGTTIGSGIFLVPGPVMRQAGGDAGVAALVWLLGSVLALLGALTFGELGAMLPDAGGSYVYVREAFGAVPAFLVGWTLFLAINTGSTATLAVAFATYLGEIVPLDPLGRKLVSVAMIAVVAGVNIRGVRHASSVQNWSTALKVSAIIALAVAALALGNGFRRGDTRAFTTPLTLASLSAAGVALLGVLWAYEGWQNVSNSAGEAADPQRTFARGIGLGAAALVVVYLTANVGYVAALGAPGVAASDRVAADAVRTLFGSAAAKLVTLVILVSIFSAANGLALTGPRMYFAMARDGVFFRALGQVHPRFGTPAAAIAASAAWAGLLALTGRFEQLFTYVVFASWLFAALAAASLFVLRRRRPDALRPFRVPGYPVTPALFIAAAAAIVVNTVAARPVQALYGLGIVATGVPAYILWRRRGTRRATEMSSPAP